MVTENTLMKFGLTKDKDNARLKEVFKDGIRLKEVHIDLYADNPLINSSEPFMLLSRIIEKKITVKNDDERLVLEKSDTYFINVLFSKITECYYKGTDRHSEFVLNIQNIYYRIIVFN